MKDETHLDIFSGLGGFAIAAREAGFRTVAFCESDSRCREFLEKTWGLPVEPDIRKLDGRKYAGVSLLTGGPPCQPASRAGKQGGAGDDRWLWNEALRVLEEANPDCVVFENPPGILDVGIDGILSEMGRLGYKTGCFDIPACAVDSPQLRHRIWIVGFASGERAERKREPRVMAGEGGQAESEAQQRERSGDAIGDSGENSSVADSECGRRRQQLRINAARESLSSTKRREGASRHGSGFENGDMANTAEQRQQKHGTSRSRKRQTEKFGNRQAKQSLDDNASRFVADTERVIGSALARYGFEPVTRNEKGEICEGWRWIK